MKRGLLAPIFLWGESSLETYPDANLSHFFQKKNDSEDRAKITEGRVKKPENYSQEARQVLINNIPNPPEHDRCSKGICFQYVI